MPIDRTLLVVDDDEDLRTVLSAALRHEGYRVYAARNGQDAFELLKGIHRPLAIILDLRMPIMNGWQLMTALDQHPSFASIPRMVITASECEPSDPIPGVPIFPKPLCTADIVRALHAVEREGQLDTPRPAPTERMN